MSKHGFFRSVFLVFLLAGAALALPPTDEEGATILPFRRFGAPDVPPGCDPSASAAAREATLDDLLPPLQARVRDRLQATFPGVVATRVHFEPGSGEQSMAVKVQVNRGQFYRSLEVEGRASFLEFEARPATDSLRLLRAEIAPSLRLMNLYKWMIFEAIYQHTAQSRVVFPGIGTDANVLLVTAVAGIRSDTLLRELVNKAETNPEYRGHLSTELHDQLIRAKSAASVRRLRNEILGALAVTPTARILHEIGFQRVRRVLITGQPESLQFITEVAWGLAQADELPRLQFETGDTVWQYPPAGPRETATDPFLDL